MSLNSLFKKEEKAENSESIRNEAEQATPFDYEMFLDAWKAYSLTIDPREINLLKAFEYCKISIGENLKVEIAVTNGFLASSLKEQLIKIRPFMANRLKNNLFEIEILEKEVEAHERRVYTDSQKYEVMVEMNPVLDFMRRTFNLEID